MRRRRFRKSILCTLIVLVILIAGTTLRLSIAPHDAIAHSGAMQAAYAVKFISDHSWLDEQNQRQLEQRIFDEIFELIDAAEKLIVLDMFLFTEWQGPVPEMHRSLAAELTDRLVARKQLTPGLTIIFISDPINTVYGGLESTHVNRLRAAGISVVLTPLEKLQDSNPLWSGIWRTLIAPFGNAPGTLLPNPFGAGRVSLRSYLALLNFKANHRKLLLADDGNGVLSGLVSSANPHDGSSAHRNVALRFSGDAVGDLLAGELALLEMAEADEEVLMIEQALQGLPNSESRFASVDEADSHHQSYHLQVLSESRIHDAVLQRLASAESGDSIELAMFYLSDRHIIGQLIAAQHRGVSVKVLLDVNNDAFGRTKNGVPNRPVAAELNEAGISVRWCATLGEQCHAKWLYVQNADEHAFFIGSANFTRRNLHDFNLETNVMLLTDANNPTAKQMRRFFSDQWNNTPGRTYSYGYDAFADDSLWLKMQYRIMELTGLSTF